MLSNIGPMQLLVIMLILIVLFGSKRIITASRDIGIALRDLRHSIQEEPDNDSKT